MAALLVSGGARAQDCLFPPIPTSAAQPPPPVFTGGVTVLSPSVEATNVPLNVEIRVGGTLAELDTTPPNFLVELLDADGARVPLLRDGAVFRPAAALQPDERYIARAAPTETNPCVDCFFAHEVPFTTGVAEDHEPPELPVEPPVAAFVLPSQEDLQRCGIFTQETHSIVMDIGQLMTRDAALSIAVRHERADPQFVAELPHNTGNLVLVTSGGTVATRVGDGLLVALTARDLAGNVSPARVIRTRARPVRDFAIPVEDREDLSCEVPASLEVRAADPLPTNGLVQVGFPFEELPISLRADDDTFIPLVAVGETLGGHVFAPGGPLTAGARYDIVPRACPHCVCAGCGALEPVAIEVGDAEDRTAPARPRIIGWDEELEPAPATDVCRADRAALIVKLEPGDDDTTDALALRYRARIKIGDGVTVELGDGHAPRSEDDGTVSLRIETPGLPRVLGDPFTFTLDVKDAAGNTSTTVETVDPDAPADEASGVGCSTAGGAPSLLAALLGMLVVRRRGRYGARG